MTVVRAGFKDNVVPGEASAIVNHRIHPSETLVDILSHDRKVIDDERVNITPIGYVPPPPVSPYSNDVTPFQIIANSALQVWKPCIRCPELRIRVMREGVRCFLMVRSLPGPWWPTLTPNTTFTSHPTSTGQQY